MSSKIVRVLEDGRINHLHVMPIKLVMYTNVLFLLPILAAWYRHEWIYFTLSLSIGIMSASFHFLEYKKDNRFLSLRTYDRILSGVCYAYMIYFSIVFLSFQNTLIAFLGLVFSIILYIYSKLQKIQEKEYFWHTLFHICISLVAAIIVLLK